MSINIDWDKLTFSLTPTKCMYIQKTDDGGVWQEGEYRPFGDISLSPAAGILNYGQGLFEGLKAYRAKTGEVTLFREKENIIRMNNGAKRLAMSPFPEEKFLEVVRELIKRNKDYIPPYGKGALYIRPLLFGSSPLLGVKPSKQNTMLIFVSPVGPYFKAGFKAIELVITQKYHRAAGKGTGHVKNIGNYSGGMLPAKEVKDKGYGEVIYLDAKYDKYVEEVGAANFFCVKDNVLYTPQLGSILPGITRKSIIQIAREELNMEVIEKKIPYEDVLDSDEAFASGTAAVISSIGSITFQGKKTVYNNMEVGEVTAKLYKHLRALQSLEIKDTRDWVSIVDLG